MTVHIGQYVAAGLAFVMVIIGCSLQWSHVTDLESDLINQRTLTAEIFYPLFCVLLGVLAVAGQHFENHAITSIGLLGVGAAVITFHSADGNVSGWSAANRFRQAVDDEVQLISTTNDTSDNKELLGSIILNLIATAFATLAAIPWSKDRQATDIPSVGVLAVALVGNIVMSAFLWQSDMATFPAVVSPGSEPSLLQLLSYNAVWDATSTAVTLAVVALFGVGLDVPEYTMVTSLFAGYQSFVYLINGFELEDIQDQYSNDNGEYARAATPTFFVCNVIIMVGLALYFKNKFESPPNSRGRVLNGLVCGLAGLFLLAGSIMLWTQVDDLARQTPGGTAVHDDRNVLICVAFAFIAVGVMGGGAVLSAYREWEGLTQFFILAAAGAYYFAIGGDSEFGWSVTNIYRDANMDDKDYLYTGTGAVARSTAAPDDAIMLGGLILVNLGAAFVVLSLVMPTEYSVSDEYLLRTRLGGGIATALCLAGAIMATVTNSAQVTQNNIGSPVFNLVFEDAYSPTLEFVTLGFTLALFVMLGVAFKVTELVSAAVVLAVGAGLSAIEDGFSLVDDIQDATGVSGRVEAYVFMSLIFAGSLAILGAGYFHFVSLLEK